MRWHIPGSRPARASRAGRSSTPDRTSTGRTPWLATVCCAVTAALLACSSNEEPPEEIPPIGRVLLISIDTLRADHLGSYGFPLATSPSLDVLASEGVRFESVISSSPITLPSHATILTGTYPPTHTVHDNDMYKLPASSETLAELLKAEGFATGAVVSAVVLDSHTGMNQGFDEYYDRFEGGRKAASSGYKERSAETTTRLAIDFVERHQNQPFFLFVHYYDPHQNWAPPLGWAGRFPGDPYSDEIAYTDHSVGLLLDRLRELGLYDDSLIVLTSDHGENLGEHGEPTHSYFVYQGTQHVPLIVRGPGLPAGTVAPWRASIADIVPTILSQLGLAVPAQVEGRDLSPDLSGHAPDGDRHVYCESLTPTKLACNPLLSVVSSRWKYIETTRPELYDLSSDPKEQVNLYAERPDIAEAMSQELVRILAGAGDSHEGAHVLAPEPRESLIALGYVYGVVDDSLKIDPELDDPKDLIEVYAAMRNLYSAMSRGDRAQAKELIATIRRRRPANSDMYRHMAEFAVREKRPIEALSHVQLYEALSRAADRGHPAARAVYHRKFAEVMRTKAQALVQLKRYEEAEAAVAASFAALDAFDLELQEIGEASPSAVDRAWAYAMLGYIRIDAGRPEEARAEMQRALDLDPGNEMAKLYLDGAGDAKLGDRPLADDAAPL